MRINFSTKIKLYSLLGLLLFAFVFQLGSVSSAYAADAQARLAVLPWKVNAAPEHAYLRSAVTDMLASRVGAGQGAEIEIVRGDLVEKAVKAYPVAARTEKYGKVARKIGKATGADFVLYGSISLLGGVASLDATLLDVKEGKVTPLSDRGEDIDALLEMTERMAFNITVAMTGVDPSANPTYTGRFAAGGGSERSGTFNGSVGEGFFRHSAKSGRKFGWKKNFNDFAIAMELADLDGDGRKEGYILTRTDVIVTKVGAKGFERVARVKGGQGVRNVSISAFDSDGDGKQELYVSRLKGDFADSCILEKTGGAYRFTSCGLPYFVRAVVVEGDGPVLISQGFRREWGFSKKLYRMEKGSKGLKKAARFKLPKGVDLYDFELFDLTAEGENNLVTLETDRRIRIYIKKGRKWKLDWTSPDRYGGTLNVIELAVGKQQGDIAKTVKFPSKFIRTDLDGDGLPELIVKKNDAGGVFGERSERVRHFKSGTIRSLSWDGVILEENWRTKEMVGYIADVLVDDTDGDGISEVMILFVDEGRVPVDGSRSTVVSYIFSGN
ncbi:hypothetical protein MNBD_DELTA01-1413 [hydrothermal vent metagenome]|uniref:VCBS repeat-containing protein n=1 Tax=hydrothermal vent metagenome TaxID=652676 RepID=A0A3B0QPK6_9ZZZZ